MIHLAYFSYVYVCCYVMQINYCSYTYIIDICELCTDWLILVRLSMSLTMYFLSVNCSACKYRFLWIMSLLADLTNATRFGCQLSLQLSINRSIVQGSGIGPVLFIMFAHDLKPLDILNYLLKYADVSLLCPQNSRTSVELEMTHVIHWARENKWLLIYWRRWKWFFSHDLLPSVMPDVRRVATAKLLGVHLRQNLTFLSM